MKDKKCPKVRDHCYYTEKYKDATHSIWNLKCSVSKKVFIDFRNGSKYDNNFVIKEFHSGSKYDNNFIIKELTEEFKIKFTCLGKYTKKHITFTVPIVKEVTRIDKTGEEITRNISYILQFIDSAKFMRSSWLNLLNNRSELIKCKFGHNDNNCETFGIKYNYFVCFLEFKTFKDDLIKFKCLCCNKNYQHKFDENVKEQFFNTYRFSNYNNNKFNLLLQKDVYPYEYIDYWEKFNETSLPEK